jgi:hypothetical protein
MDDNKLICPLMSTMAKVEYTRERVDELIEAECIEERCALWIADDNSKCIECTLDDACEASYTGHCALRGIKYLTLRGAK